LTVWVSGVTPWFFVRMAKMENLLGIDIGSSHVRAVIAQEIQGDEKLRVLGSVSFPSEGIRRGSVVDPDTVAATVGRAIEHAERMAGVSPRTVGFGVSGTDIFCQKASGVIAIGRSDGEVTDGDVERVIEEVESRVMLPANREVLHVVPTSYRLDDQTNIKDPVGMRGVRLEAEAFVIGTSMRQMKGFRRKSVNARRSISPCSIRMSPSPSHDIMSPKSSRRGSKRYSVWWTRN